MKAKYYTSTKIMNSKEDILKSHVKDIYLFNHGTLEKREQFQAAVHLAMEEWAKQCVYLFGQFILKNDIAYDNFKNPEWGLLNHSQKEQKFFNEFLPSLFQDQSKQQ